VSTASGGANGKQGANPSLPADGSSPVPGGDAQDVRSAMATHFDGMGTTGGCGVPPALVDSQDYVALNVEYTPYPGPYTMDSRPIVDPALLGQFDNGRNCGRWVHVTIGEYCTGANGGSNGQDFCVGGQWITDELSGAELTLLVADSCQDPNGWCRDDRYHLDLHTPALGRFTKSGQPVGNALAEKWDNRRITWRYVEAPAYSGDVKIHFVPGAQPYWPAVAITNLRNGIHGVERLVGGVWKSMPMVSDNGQVYLLASSPSQDGEGPPYVIRIRDASGQLVENGRTYAFDLPCSGPCADYTPVTYTSSP
jgi:hypothetical protein